MGGVVALDVGHCDIGGGRIFDCWVKLASEWLTLIVFSSGAISEMRYFVLRATTYMCLHAEWFLLKKLQVQLLTVPMKLFWV